jgi:transglutaminase/protease-like cytokinesis protein 3
LGYKTGYWDNYTSTVDLANDTYFKRKGICSGYSYLFKYFCNELNIDCEVINGYSRTEFAKAGLPFEKTNHSWNIIKLNDKWQYVDATWGYATAKTKDFNLYYFLTPYNEFESNHFPKDVNWLLSKKMTKETFNTLPYISFEYFRSKLYNGKYPSDGLLKAKGDSVQIILPDTKDNPKILIRLLDYKNRKWMPPTYNSLSKGDDLQINIKELSKGKFLLRVDLFEERDSIANIKRGLVYFTVLNQ